MSGAAGGSAAVAGLELVVAAAGTGEIADAAAVVSAGDDGAEDGAGSCSAALSRAVSASFWR